MTLDDDIRRLEAEMPRIRVYQGAYVGRVDGQTFVDVDQAQRIPASLMFPPPPVGTDVRVWDLNGEWVIAGLVEQPPSEGVVSTIGGTRVTVITDRGEFSVPYQSTYTPSSGDTVQLTFNEQGLSVLGRLSEEITPTPVPAPPVVTTPRPADLFTATSSGSAKRGTSTWSTNQVVANPDSIGVYVYGSKIRDTLASGPTPTELWAYLPIVRNGYGQMRLGWHPLEERTGTTPTVSQLRTIDDVGDGWVDITDLIDSLKGGGGIGFDGAGDTVFQGVPVGGRSGDPQAGALRAIY